MRVPRVTLAPRADGDTVTIILTHSIVGLGAAGDVLLVVQDAEVDALYALGWAAPYTGPTPPANPIVAVSTGPQDLTGPQRTQAGINLGLPGMYVAKPSGQTPGTVLTVASDGSSIEFDTPVSDSTVSADLPTGTSTTDSANLAAKITSAAGKTIRVRAGTYVLHNVAVSGSAHLFLDAGAVLQLKAAATLPMFNFTGTSLIIEGPGTVDGNKAGQTGRLLDIVTGNVPAGSRLVFKGAAFTNTLRSIAYVSNFGGYLAMEGCTVNGQAEHDGTLGHQTSTLFVTSGQGGTQLGTSLALAAAGDTVTKNAHGLSNGTPVMLLANTATGVSNNVTYYVTGATTNTFQLALNPGGAALDITVDGTATVRTVNVPTGLIRYNQNRHYGTIAPALAGGSPGGLFVAVNGYDTTGGGAPGTDGFANGNMSTVEAIGNYFYGYGQNCAGNDIAPLHFYPSTRGARLIGNVMVGCGFSAIAAKSVQDFVCKDNVVIDGQISAQNTSSEGAISYVPGYQAGTLPRIRAVIEGNIVINPGGQASDNLQVCYNIGGLSTSLAADVVFANNIGAGGGPAARLNQAQNIKIVNNRLVGGSTSTTGGDKAVILANCSGDVELVGNTLTAGNGDVIQALAGNSTANIYLLGGHVTQKSSSYYGVDIRGAAFLKFGGGLTIDAPGTAVYAGADGSSNPIGWLAWDNSVTIKSGALSLTWTQITKATGALGAPNTPAGSVTPGEVGTTYRQTNGTSDSVLWVSVGTTSADWVKQLSLVAASVGGPADNNMLGWTFNPRQAITGQTMADAGILDVSEITLLAGGGISNVYYWVDTAGTSLTSGQCFIGMFDASGNLLGQSADITTILGRVSTGAGEKTPLTATTTAQNPGAKVRIVLLWNGTGTAPKLRGVNGTGLPNIGITAVAQNVHATAGSGLTAVPSTLPTLAATNTSPWWGVS